MGMNNVYFRLQNAPVVKSTGIMHRVPGHGIGIEGQKVNLTFDG